MVRLDNISDRVRSMAGPLMVACLLAYFGFHSIQGERGILTWLQLDHQISRTAQALEASRADGVRLIASGRSMGGRVASMIVAAGESVDALALFAYPLHAPGRSDQPRTEHLPAIRVPTLFCSGTRDGCGSPEELERAAALVDDGELHLLNGADHGFATLKSSGRTREDVWREAIDAMTAWLDTPRWSRG